MSKRDGGNCSTTPLSVPLQNAATCPGSVLLPVGAHVISSEMRSLSLQGSSVLLFPPGHCGTLRLSQQSGRSSLRDDLGQPRIPAEQCCLAEERDTTHYLKQEQVRLDVRKNFFHVVTVKPWTWLCTLSLRVFMSKLV